MSTLKEQLIRLGSTNPELQEHIRPVLDSLTRVSSRKGQGASEVPHLIDKAMGELNDWERDLEDLVDEVPSALLRDMHKVVDHLSKAMAIAEKFRTWKRQYRVSATSPQLQHRQASAVQIARDMKLDGLITHDQTTQELYGYKNWVLDERAAIAQLRRLGVTDRRDVQDALYELKARVENMNY